MKMKSVSGITCYVKNVDRAVRFYETLGFTFRKREPRRATAYLNWFWIDLLAIKDETRTAFRKEAELKGPGPLISISVEDVDAFYDDLLSKGLKPSTKPQDSPWGNREFLLRDPDKNKLVFFEKK
jgi:catechol 2,3-dioxygenase-like lactoylglutathione lyase family enzyme